MKKYLSEFIGTLVLVLFICGTAVASGLKGAEYNVAYLLTALVAGFVIVAMAYSVGNISGCHINPAVSIAMLVSGKMDLKDFIGYVLAQFLGALAGAGLVVYILGTEAGLGANALFQGDAIKSLIIEGILTFVFVFAILGVTSKAEFSNVAGLVIGFSLVLIHILGIGLTGASVNPARSFGPAILLGGEALSVLWVYIVGPLAGGILAALSYKFLSSDVK